MLYFQKIASSKLSYDKKEKMSQKTKKELEIRTIK